MEVCVSAAVQSSGLISVVVFASTRLSFEIFLSKVHPLIGNSHLGAGIAIWNMEKSEFPFCFLYKFSCIAVIHYNIMLI